MMILSTLKNWNGEERMLECQIYRLTLPSASSSMVRECDQSDDDLMQVTTSGRSRLPVFQLLTSTQVEQSCETLPCL